MLDEVTVIICNVHRYVVKKGTVRSVLIRDQVVIKGEFKNGGCGLWPMANIEALITTEE